MIKSWTNLIARTMDQKKEQKSCYFGYVVWMYDMVLFRQIKMHVKKLYQTRLKYITNIGYKKTKMSHGCQSRLLFLLDLLLSSKQIQQIGHSNRPNGFE